MSSTTTATAQQTLPSSQNSTPVSDPSTDSIVKEVKEEGSKYAALSSYLGSPTHSSDPGSPPSLSTVASSPLLASKDYPYLTLKGKNTDRVSTPEDGIAVVVENILQHRKNLRMSLFGRMFKIPFMKEKKKRIMQEAPLDQHRWE